MFTKVYSDILIVYKNFIHWNISKTIISISSFLFGILVSLPFILIAALIGYLSPIDWKSIIGALYMGNSVDVFILNELFKNIVYFAFIIFLVIFGVLAFFLGNSYKYPLISKLYLSYIDGEKRIFFKGNDYFSFKKLMEYFSILFWLSIYLLIPFFIFLVFLFIFIFIFGGLNQVSSMMQYNMINIFSISIFIFFILALAFFFYLIYRTQFSLFLFIEKNNKNSNKSSFLSLLILLILLLLILPIIILPFVFLYFFITNKKLPNILFKHYPELIYLQDSISITKSFKIFGQYLLLLLSMILLISPFFYIEANISGTKDELQLLVSTKTDEVFQKTMTEDNKYEASLLEKKYIDYNNEDLKFELTKYNAFSTVWGILYFLFLGNIETMLFVSFYRRVLIADKVIVEKEAEEVL